VKDIDPAKQQGQLLHKQNVAMPADIRKQLGVARAVTGLRTISEEPNPSDPNAYQQQQDAELPPTN
jgi:hypothetical protein